MVWKKQYIKRPVFCKITDTNRYPRAIKNPAGAGLCHRDYDSQHGARAWPTGTEYMYSFCSNYTPPHDRQEQEQQQQHRFKSLEQQMRQCKEQCDQYLGQQQFSYNSSLHQVCQGAQRLRSEQEQGVSTPHADGDYRREQQQPKLSGNPYEFKLHDPTPAPLVDKHYRGSHYQPGHPLGVQVPEELSRVRHTRDGPVRINCEDDMSNVYLPLYRYKDWVERSELEVWRDCNTSSLLCRYPDAPTQFWDFYNEVRMNRPAKKLQQTATYGTCRVLPIARDTDIQGGPSDNLYTGQYGRESRFHESAHHQPTSLCRC